MHTVQKFLKYTVLHHSQEFSIPAQILDFVSREVNNIFPESMISSTLGDSSISTTIFMTILGPLKTFFSKKVLKIGFSKSATDLNLWDSLT